MHADEEPTIPSLFSKDAVTLLITDSGLGGLSIFAEIASRLKREPVHPRVSLIYYNAWPEPDRGYNALEDMDERVRVFDGALEGMMRYEPDMILIACNTLSVLYGRTAFNFRERIPVVDIVRFGTEMVYEYLHQNPDAKALLLGTVTTIASDLHRQQLIAQGISSERIVPQPCDRLATLIEKGPESDAVRVRIDSCMDQAVQCLGKIQNPVGIALLCTHFGYSRDLIRESLRKRIPWEVTLLDPNQRMADFIFKGTEEIRCDKIVLNMSVASRIRWDPDRLDAISGVIEPQSTETAEALRNYQWIPDLFSF